jgi:hypothetical protein
VSSISPFAACKARRKWLKMVRIAQRFLPFLAFVELTFTHFTLQSRQKDTVKLIAEQEQHYLIALKNNQPNLGKTLDNLHQTTVSLRYSD